MFEERIALINRQTEEESAAATYEKRIYIVDEIQDILGISRTTAYKLVRSNVFHYVQIGGHYRISKKSFDAWLDNQVSACQVCESV